MTRITELKVKYLSLAAESRIIRHQERRLRDRARKAALKNKTDAVSRLQDTRMSLHQHRLEVVRPVARAAHVACSFLRGREYAEIERVSDTDPNWEAVQNNVKKFGGKEDQERFQDWRERARVHRRARGGVEAAA